MGLKSSLFDQRLCTTDERSTELSQKNHLLTVIIAYRASCLYFISKELHNQWNELQEKLYDEVIIPLTAYQSQFPDIKVFNHWHRVCFVFYRLNLLLHIPVVCFLTFSLTHSLIAFVPSSTYSCKASLTFDSGDF